MLYAYMEVIHQEGETKMINPVTFVELVRAHQQDISNEIKLREKNYQFKTRKNTESGLIRNWVMSIFGATQFGRTNNVSGASFSLKPDC